MVVFLFDIDGTLVKTGGAGGTALLEAFGEIFDICEPERVPFSGRTDRGIVQNLFRAHEIAEEIEQALIEHPAVLEAAVVAHRDDDDLEKPKAFVVLKDAQDAAAVGEMKDYIKDKIGKWKYPRWIEVVDDLPKTATGKIQRFKLRAPA